MRRHRPHLVGGIVLAEVSRIAGEREPWLTRQRENGDIIDCPTCLIAVKTCPVASGNKMASQKTIAPTTSQMIVLSFTAPNHSAAGEVMQADENSRRYLFVSRDYTFG